MSHIAVKSLLTGLPSFTHSPFSLFSKPRKDSNTSPTVRSPITKRALCILSVSSPSPVNTWKSVVRSRETSSSIRPFAGLPSLSSHTPSSPFLYPKRAPSLTLSKSLSATKTYSPETTSFSNKSETFTLLKRLSSVSTRVFPSPKIGVKISPTDLLPIEESPPFTISSPMVDFLVTTSIIPPNSTFATRSKKSGIPSFAE